jgi:hypothetical protein
VFELLGDLYTLPVGGGAATRITSGQGYDMQPRYSADGERIVFVSDRNGSENLWVADADGSDAEALTKGEKENYMSPIWAPEEDYVLATKGSQLWLYHLDGGSGLQVTGHDDGAPAHMGVAQAAAPAFLWVNLRGRPQGGFPSDTSRHSAEFAPPGRPVSDRSSRPCERRCASTDTRTGGRIPTHREPRWALAGVCHAV